MRITFSTAILEVNHGQTRCDKTAVGEKRKKNIAVKKKNRIKTIKYIIIFIVVQLVILYFFGTTFHEYRQATVENTRTVVGYADYVQERDRHTPLVIYMNSTGYRFDDETYHFFQKDKVSKLYDHLSSEKLTIKYYEVYGLRYKVIVDIRSNNYVYYTMEDYNEHGYSNRIFFMILLIVFELIYLAILFFAVLCWHDSVTEIKDRFKKLRKQQAMNKTD